MRKLMAANVRKTKNVVHEGDMLAVCFGSARAMTHLSQRAQRGREGCSEPPGRSGGTSENSQSLDARRPYARPGVPAKGVKVFETSMTVSIGWM